MPVFQILLLILTLTCPTIALHESEVGNKNANHKLSKPLQMTNRGGVTTTGVLQANICTIRSTLGNFNIKRPSITASSPSEMSVLNLRPVTVTGQFHNSTVYVRLIGPDRVLLGPLPVKAVPRSIGQGLEFERSSPLDPLPRIDPFAPLGSVTFIPPSHIRSGIYSINIETAQHLNCASKESARLTILPPEPGKLWFVATLQKIEVRNAREPFDNLPAEARFVMSAQSRTPAMENKRFSQFPAGPYIGLQDRFDDDNFTRTIYPQVPIFWDLKERMGPEFGLAMAGYERDGSADLDWAGPALSIVGGAIGCYVGGLAGCATGIEIGNKAEELLRDFLSNEDDSYGTLGETCPQTSNYCIGLETGKDSNVRDYTMPQEDSNQNLNVDIEYRMIEAPRLDSIKVSLRDVRLFQGTADNDDDWERGGEDIWIRYRIAPLQLLGQQLNTARSLPREAPDKTFSMCTDKEQMRGCGFPSWLRFSSTDGLLFPHGDEAGEIQDANGVPALYVEISVWESDSENDQHLIGTHSATYWLSDLLKNRAEYKTTIGAEIRSINPFRCPPPEFGSVCIPSIIPTWGWLAYDLEVKRKID